MDDYKEINELLKKALKLSRKRGYSLKDFKSLASNINKLRTKDRRKLKKHINKLYSMFDYEKVREEIKSYYSVLKIAKAYSKDNAINLDMMFIEDLEKRNEALYNSHTTLINAVDNHPLDQKRIDMAIEKFLHNAEDISYLDKMSGDIAVKVDEAGHSVRKAVSLRQKAAVLITALVIGMSAVTGAVPAAGLGNVAMAGEVQQDKAFYEGLAKQAEELNASKNFNEVVDLLDKYRDTSTSSNLLDELASAHGRLGHIDLAIQLYKKAIELDPNNTDAYYNLGGIYGYVKKDKEKSIEYYQLYIEHKGPNIEKAKAHIKKLS